VKVILGTLDDLGLGERADEARRMVGVHLKLVAGGKPS